MNDVTSLLVDFIDCHYKALLVRSGEPSVDLPAANLMDKQQLTYAQRGRDKLTSEFLPAQILNRPVSLARSLRQQHRLILDARCAFGSESVSVQAIEIVRSSHSEDHQLVPVFFFPQNRISERERLIVSALSLVVLDNSSLPVGFAKIVQGDGFNVKRVVLRGAKGATRVAMAARHVLDAFHDFNDGSKTPKLRLNSHCEICGFKERCFDEAVQRDDLSLMRALTSPEIDQLNAKGVFTTTQLGLSFQPRRYVRNNYQPKHHSHSLQALALSEQTVFVRQRPEIPTSPLRIFLDVEGIPDDQRYYLVGMLVAGACQEVWHHFWSNGPDDEKSMWEALLKELASLPDDFVVYHYGSFERTFVRHMHERYNDLGGEILPKLNDCMHDVHSSIRTNVFFPAYSNRLKDVASALGAQWTGQLRSGFESTFWRKEWECTREESLKNALIVYNREDCVALRRVVVFLKSLADEAPTTSTQVQVKPAPHTSSASQYGFGTSSIAIPKIKEITKRAYFNYQQERVFIRTDQKVRRTVRRKQKSLKRKFRINQRISCEHPKTCPRCGDSRVRSYTSSEQKKVVKDLRFTPSGVKRWVVEYTTDRWHCRNCSSTGYSTEYPTKKGTVGHGAASWFVHQHVASRQSWQSATDSINDLFGLDFGVRGIGRSIRELATDHRCTEHRLLQDLRQGSFICADETKVQVRGGTGYVWAFSGVEEVVYRFTESRDSSILEEVVDGFKGVLVSDFYSGYDSATCSQQKCIVHLIRDINDDLLKQPFDEELKKLAERFTSLITEVVHAIDRFGLRKRHLNRFTKRAQQFRAWVDRQEFKSKLAQRYQKRIRKYGDRLFTFLAKDGVPWNNNIAENAIKLVASRRRLFGASFSVQGMKDYLLFLSFFQTLRRKGGSLLRFLLSKESDLSKFMGEKR